MDGNNGQGQVVDLSRLRDKRFNGYLRIRLPHELDTEVETIVAAYMQASTPVRQRMTDSIDGRTAGVFSAYGQRMASTAVRAQSVEPLKRGLVSVSLAEGRLNQPYDNLFVLAALNDAAIVIGSTLKTVLADVARVLPQTGLTAIQKFDQRQDRDKTLESMGLRTTGSGQTFLYE
ncbi:hypothetical protein ACFYZI_40725 [Streptomyces griseorubiginosus]|uniref:hypothetical protein n=1 Tax=Streptomyces griseorubiginosus TaxID=67304 RepID=UPI0036A61AA5